MINKKLLRNRKGFLARDWIMALILFSGLIALMIIMVGSTASDYDNEGIIDPTISEDFANLEATTQISENAFDAANEKEGLSFLGSFDILFSSAFTIIALVFDSVSIATAYLVSLGTTFGIPTAVSQILFSIIISIAITILVFVVISTTTRRDF